jgi:hypothetical protein
MKAIVPMSAADLECVSFVSIEMAIAFGRSCGGSPYTSRFIPSTLHGADLDVTMGA